VTIGQDAHDNLERARALLRHVIPSGDPAALVERALALLVQEAERTKCAKTARPRSPVAAVPHAAVHGRETRRPNAAGRRPNRVIPAAVKRAVWERDAGRCAFVGAAGRCSETGFLEFHHVVPFAAGGTSDMDNLQLRCRAHNAHEARGYFGAEIGGPNR
jgi:hypothetical protein